IADEIEDTIIINNQRPKAYRRHSKNGSITTTVVVENLKISDKYKKGGITSKKKYRKKVDIAISFRRAKKISKELYGLFDSIKLGGIHASEGEIYLLQYVRFTNQNFGILSDICSAKISSKPEVQHAGQMIDFLYCIKGMVKEFIKQIKKIEEEVKRISEFSDNKIEKFDNLGKFLKTIFKKIT
ncbi:34662_t:CDS:2, partial [Racocetra persica]